MNRTETVAWVLSVCTCYLRLSQAKTLGHIVAGAVRVQRMSLANLGRALQGTAKHQIKRVWRFCSNPRVETADAMRGVLQRVLKKRKKALLLAIDWVDIRGFQTLMISAVFKGRSLPICWSSCKKNVYDGHRSRNAFEESLLLVLRGMIPESVRIILLADRGFGRTALARFCLQYRIDYLIRIQPNVKVKLKGFEGKLLDYPIRKGIDKVLQDALYRSDGAVTQNVVIRWRKNLPKHRDECWFLMTSLSGTAASLCALFARRMSIEQLFRDGKNKRNGWSLRDTQLTSPDRLDRLILILALAYLLICGVGLLAKIQFKPKEWCASSKDQCSVFQIGMILWRQTDASPSRALAEVIRCSESVLRNWG
jgi:Transposase DDE domain